MNHWVSRETATQVWQNFHFQVPNGGFPQWCENAYAKEDSDVLKFVVARGRMQHIKHMEKIEQLILDAERIGFDYAETEARVACHCMGYDAPDCPEAVAQN